MLETLLCPYPLPPRCKPHRVCGLYAIQPGQTLTLADFDGPGCIRRLYLTMQPRRLRDLVLRCYWDGEGEPSIECPVSDFFGIGHDLTTAELRTPLFYVAPLYGYNCYIPMPFARGAQVTLTDEGEEPVAGINVMIEAESYAPQAGLAEMPWRLHAAWRRVMPAYRRGAPFTLLEARGHGRLLGVFYHVCKRDPDDRWSHGGGDQIFIDGDTAEPAYVYGIGGEDFAHHAWGLSPGQGWWGGAHLVHPLPGVKRGEGPSPFEPHGWEQHDGGRYSMYRFFVPDRVMFQSSLRLVFGTAANEISATTYWYQSEPHTRFCTLPPAAKRSYSIRLTEEETWRPLDLGQPIPVAVLGPLREKDLENWSGQSAVDLNATYDTGVKQPFGDVVHPPHQVRWRRSEIRGGFIDLAAIHRPKAAIRPRGLWNKRHLPLGAVSHQLIRLTVSQPRSLTLRIGFEDRLWVYHNTRLLATLTRPEPQVWHTRDVELDLSAGTHDLVLTHTQDRWARWSTWGLYVKFLERDGSLADDLAFENFRGLDPTPERWREPWPPHETGIDSDDYRDPLFLV